MKITRFSFLSALALLAITALPQTSQAQISFANWTSNTTGTLGGVNFTMTGLTVSFIGSTYDLSGSEYSAAPGSTMQESLDYQGDSSWTVTFDSPVNDLNVYSIFWRTNGYTLDKSFAIASGMSNTTTLGNTITTNDGFTNGIIRIPGSTSSLTVSVPGGNSFQALNFSLGSASSAAPEPGTLALLALGGGLVIIKRRRC
jgi:hypothetical protein